MCDPTLPQSCEFHTLVHAGEEVQGFFLSPFPDPQGWGADPMLRLVQRSASLWFCALFLPFSAALSACFTWALLCPFHAANCVLLNYWKGDASTNGLSLSSTFITFLRPINQFFTYSLQHISAVNRWSRSCLKNGRCSAHSAGDAALASLILCLSAHPQAEADLWTLGSPVWEHQVQLDIFPLQVRVSVCVVGSPETAPMT